MSTPTVFVTAAGGAGTTEIICDLKKSRYTVVAADASGHAYGLHLAQQSHLIPRADRQEFLPRVRELLERVQPDYVIPLVDEEILPFHELSDPLPFRVVAPGPSFCRWTLDKWETHKRLDDENVPTPHTERVSDSPEITKPSVLKPRRGRGSTNVHFPNNTRELQQVLECSPLTPDSFVLQERISGTEYTVSVVVDLRGRLHAIVPKRVLLKEGITKVSVTERHPAIESVCRSLVEDFNPGGPFNVQLIEPESGLPRVIEINPRYSTTVAHTMAAGVNEVRIVLDEAEGEEMTGEPSFETDLVMQRYYTHRYQSFSQFERQREEFTDRGT